MSATGGKTGPHATLEKTVKMTHTRLRPPIFAVMHNALGDATDIEREIEAFARPAMAV